MFKAIFFLWCRDGMSREHFIDYYENTHIGVMSGLVPIAFDFRRNYPFWSDSSDAGALAATDLASFDVMTEITYRNRSDFQEVLEGVTRSPAKEIIEADELAFEKRDMMKLFVVDEVSGGAGRADWRPAPSPSSGPKVIRYVRRHPDISRTEFRNRYEQEEVPRLRTEIGDVGAEYRRNYVISDDPLSFSGGHHNLSAPQEAHESFDVAEQFWFESRARLENALTLLSRASPIIYGSSIVQVEEHLTSPTPQVG
jgi:hypothetical protein